MQLHQGLLSWSFEGKRSLTYETHDCGQIITDGFFNCFWTLWILDDQTSDFTWRAQVAEIEDLIIQDKKYAADCLMVPLRVW